ncbi:MAG: WD40 repeat domain-containing protein [bacterium]|nr:WD40 repeat domain-containing protein [bacterium]
MDEKKRAEEEKTRADVNARESDRLRLLAEAEAIAVRTTGMTEEPNREQAALLALQAYRLNQRSGGEEENTQIYNAMRLALKQLGSDRLRVLHGHQAEVRSLAVAPDGRTLVSGDENGEVRLIDLDQPDREPTIVGRLGAGARALAFSTSGQEVAGGSFDGTIQIWDLSRLAAAPRILSQAGAAIYALAFRPGSAQLAAGDAGGGIRLWDLAAAEPEAEFLLHGAEQSDAAIEDHREPPHVRSLAFRADGARLAAASYGRGVLVWDLVQGVREPRLMDEEPWVRTVAFSHDGHFLVAGTDQGPVVVWDPEQPGSGPTWLRGHTSRVESLEFHPHRHLLASGSFDGTLRLWDVRNPDALPLVLEGHDFWVWAAAFSPDGERLISGSGDRTIHLWTTSSEALAAEICRTVARNLSQQEWDEYLPPEVEYEKTCPHLPAAARP